MATDVQGEEGREVEWEDVVELLPCAWDTTMPVTR